MMEELVEIVNQLQDVFSSGVCSGIDLPQIVVVGTQSAGKSSVLEHIVGKSFLPRGTGIVTRCPLVLQLVHSPDKKEECAIFQHDPNKIFTDYDLIRKEIEEQTKKLAGTNKGICQTSVNLKIYSPSLLNLTLVDLPGLTKVAVGDQPPDIEEQTRKLILKFIDNPNSIILAVTPANVDMATSDSLKIAKEVDPHGTRTLAVLTKLDLMDKGTDAWDMLHGKVIPVELGIIGVVNRSQQDINDNKSVEQSLDEEAKFLQKEYKNIAATHGNPYLTKTVQAILVNHIKSCMPDLKKRIRRQLTAKKTELSYYADKTLDKRTFLLYLIFKFTNIYISAIKGYNIKSSIKTNNLYGGARIQSVFQNFFSKDIRNINPLAGLKKIDIITAITNSNGMNPAIFVPEVAFELLAKKQVEKFRTPSLKCLQYVHLELNNIAQSCLEDENLRLDHFPVLKSVLGVVVTELLESRLPTTKQTVASFIDIQVAHINTSHPDFLPKRAESVEVLAKDESNIKVNGQVAGLGDSTKLKLLDDKAKTQTHLCINLPIDPQISRDKNSLEYVLVKELIKSYMSIVCKIVEDTIPKMIIHSLVNFLVDHLQVELVKRIYDKGDVVNFLCESPTTVSKRNQLEAEIAVLEKADLILNNLSITMVESTRHLKTFKHHDNNDDHNNEEDDNDDSSDDDDKNVIVQDGPLG